jgi:hypothetical protein
MKFLPRLIGSLLLLAAANTFAATPATNAAPGAPAPTPLPATAVAPAPAGLKLDDYINEVASTLGLADVDKKKIEDLYIADGAPLKGILDDGELLPLQKAEQVSDLRDARNAKVIELLPNTGEQEAFYKVEAKYRVALTELAANGGWVASAATAPAAK